ncbi:PTS fructose transporter subunit IIA [Enterococcus gilvus]|uniref:PTS sugar transporter subunit IIA n=1 Tax=Enterococcus gilvus TaxID=160453 RepID=UPI0028D634EE|nr:PTS fructose transporter subunit IIA [Enterococcus gilvus]
MTYLILISHGNFAEGLRDSLGMFVGEPIDNVIALGLKTNESTSAFSKRIEELSQKIPKDSRVIILGDIIGGSPLTIACNVLNNNESRKNCIILGGMNLPMALTAFLIQNTQDIVSLKKTIISEACNSLKELKINLNDSNEQDI